MVEQAIAELNQNLSASGQPFKLAMVPIESLTFLEKNARFMPNEMFSNLVSNIKADKGLSSVPFCWFDGTTYHILSGNHRVKAAKDAGLEQCLILYDDRPMSRQEFVAKQLSHNAIEGKDDLGILRDLWKELDDLGLKYYAGLDDKTLEQMADASIASLSEAKIDFHIVSFMFLPEEVERLQAAWEQIGATTITNQAWAVRLSEFERLLTALDKTKASFGIKNAATSVLLLLDVFERHQEDLAEGWAGPENTLRHKNKVPLASVLGTDMVPAALAQKLSKLGQQLVASGKVPKTEMWRVIEQLVDGAEKAAVAAK